MINTITKVVDRIINSKRLEALENKILDKYESYVTPKAVVVEPEKEEKKEPPVTEQV